MTEALLILIPVSLALVIAIGVAFWWAIFAGQFEDTREAADSILDDDDGAGQADADAARAPRRP